MELGDLKRLIGQKTGMEPQMQKLLFRGKEKDDCDPLQMAGVKDNSKVLLMEGSREKEMNSEEMEKPSQISLGGEAVAEVTAEVDKLSKQVVHFSLLFPLVFSLFSSLHVE